jgi:RHS repeat-associated protein
MYNAGSEQQPLSGTYSTFYREYDSSIGRFMALDVKASLYPGDSPYSYALNNPMRYNDPYGDTADPYTNFATERIAWLNEQGIATSLSSFWNGNGIAGGGGGSPWHQPGYYSPMQSSSDGYTSWEDIGQVINRLYSSHYGGDWSSTGGYSMFSSYSDADRFLQQNYQWVYPESRGYNSGYKESIAGVDNKDVLNTQVVEAGPVYLQRVAQQSAEMMQAGFLIPDNKLGYDEWNLAREITGAGMIYSGRPTVEKRFVTKATEKSVAASAKSSRATQFWMKTVGKTKIPRIPTPTGYPFNNFRWTKTISLGKALGRYTPWVGTALMAWDIIDLSYKLYSAYANDEDVSQVWRQSATTTVGMYNK